MVVVGGATTRLTGSGLSITEWKPILGAIPPLSAADWQEAFDKYRADPAIPARQQGHEPGRVPGHLLVGVGAPLPGPVHRRRLRHSRSSPSPFAGYIRRDLAPSLIALFALGALQGFMGWYMVQSGLVDRVSVSQYRLAAHLGLAAIIYAAMIWVMLGVGQPAQRAARMGVGLAAGLLVSRLFRSCSARSWRA